jgi:lysophospholipid acyltransferase (LPLAT)-like uncharacterized protein
MFTMKDRTPLWLRCAGMLSAGGVHAWMGTLEFQGLFFDRSVDAIFDSPTPRIYVFWHEYILIPLYIRGNCNLTMLLSRHRDADILARVAHHMGHECVRGSTYKGGTTALIELARRGRNMHMAITPDGPRGPRRKLAQGPVFLASRLGLPIVCMGLGFDRPWRTPTWDRFAIPRPFSRARAIISPEVFVPPDLDRDGLEVRRQAVERLLNELTTEAESWAASGERRTGAISAHRQSRVLGAGSMYDERGVARLAPATISNAAAANQADSPLFRRAA